ncbi:hypothetical protein L4F31_16210 [Vibrio paracholerae]|uniref:hypothetical protein n=1 Tax=Vibrio TaxID=662 RepID=UPI000C7E9D19|nr:MULTISPECIES: hypothetical protein [Vibrio]MCO7017393.1 hypothetical protein [Vibrio paracholerae]MCO7024770.1 hypothetical protein [Vibrio paracholerae]NOF49901.1 hypothetical protein [Vibrio cholerae]PKQ52159.1 hypothetical protein CR151_16835 [Vibrio cholerae]
MELNDIQQINFGWPPKPETVVTPISLSCSSSCNVFVWATSEHTAAEHLEQLKANVAKGMDQCADLLRDYQWFSPCIAVIDATKSTQFMKEFKELAGDQDWHRGRFVVQIASSEKDQTVEEIKNRWLGDLQSASYKPKRIDLETFKTLIEETIPLVKAPVGVDPTIFQRYVSQVLDAMADNKPEQMANSWQQELRDNLNSLLGQHFFEGNANG